MGKKDFKKKDKYDSLSDNFKDAVVQASTDEIRKRISEVSILDITERQVLKLDPAVEEARAKLKELVDPYRENLKSYKLQLEFCKQILDEKGGGAPVKEFAANARK